ncbi:aspartic proteinase 36 [Lactuca sativa]|uniref:Peptidase A1 domain-containing protein n=1 Tax=Lactuca sativa TaxID=4236 RepID=A0A9R1WNB2_LACSA|nr:aspartic proteinase 36 [Lactuca sativa]KAJ0228571.1 hypothetical protein LSAT_V11C100041460 [Lactuca sativa]
MSTVYITARNAVISTLLGVVVLLQAVSGFPAILTLERAFSVKHRIKLSELRYRDILRHGRMLLKDTSPKGVIGFVAEGSYDLRVAGLYYTKVKLGTPSKDYYLQIDTGSDVSWVSCRPCNDCPTSSGFNIPITLYDPSSSSTSSPISCSDQRCPQASQTYDSSSCLNNHCTYTIQYGDDSATSGHYVSDLMHFKIIVSGTETELSNTSASIVFGCGTIESGVLTTPDSALDGILGLGQQGRSIISQLSSQGITPNSFAHCLADGGGLLVIGQPMVPYIVFTPFVKSQGYYSINLQSISVNDKMLSIDPSVFAINDDKAGTIVDSGTTLAYLTEEAYTPFVDAITKSVSLSVQPHTSNGNTCYSITSSVSNIFPIVSLNFVGGASMHLRPQDYLSHQSSKSGAEVWCMGFQRSHQKGITILGDLVLKDKFIVYDLDAQRIGWARYDCFSIVQVSSNSSSSSGEAVTPSQISGGRSLGIRSQQQIPVIVISSIIYLTMMFIGFQATRMSL